MQVSKEIKARTGELSLKQMAQLAVRLAHKVFPDIAVEVREVLAEQLGKASLVEADSTNAVDEAGVVAALEGGGSSGLKTCPDCAETVKAAARKCRFCGYRFDNDADEANAPAVEIPATPTGGKGPDETLTKAHWAIDSEDGVNLGARMSQRRSGGSFGEPQN